MRKILLDCGGHSGESIQKFVKTHPGFEYYTFEANPEMIPHMINMLNTLEAPVFIYPGAVWTYDGYLDFFIGHDQGSTGLTGKVETTEGIQQVDYNAPIRVPCIDISNWILTKTNKEDKIIMKIDIEGGEYKILPKMIADGSIDRISLLYCEWHQDRFPDIKRDFHDNLVSEVRKKTMLLEWL